MLKLHYNFHVAKKHYLLLKEEVDIVTIADKIEYSVPVKSGIHGFKTALERDEAVKRLNKAHGIEEVAVAVQLLQVL